MTMTEATHGYIGKAACCGKVVFCTVDSDDHKRDTAREVARAVRDGLLVERHPIEDIRTMSFGRCKCKCKQGKVQS